MENMEGITQSNNLCNEIISNVVKPIYDKRLVPYIIKYNASILSNTNHKLGKMIQTSNNSNNWFKPPKQSFEPVYSLGTSKRGLP